MREIEMLQNSVKLQDNELEDSAEVTKYIAPRWVFLVANKTSLVKRRLVLGKDNSTVDLRLFSVETTKPFQPLRLV
eukprot:g80157.t1